jgi:hypothetical protein
MSGELKPGDRVRVTEGSRVAGYLPGDKGTILYAFKPETGDGECFYSVAMDKDEPALSGPVFAEVEIEPDV